MKSRKRILMILENNSFPDDTRVRLEAHALVSGGYDVCVICPKGDNARWRETIDDVEIVRYPSPPEWGGAFGYFVEYAYSFAAALLITSWIWIRRGFDAIHVHCPPDLNIGIGWLFKLFGTKCVYDMHDLSPELFQAQRGDKVNKTLLRGLLFFERFACRNASRLIATNETQQSIQLNRGGASKENCYIIRNGPNTQFLDFPASNGSTNNSIGYIGLIGVQDGVEHLVKAAKSLVDEFGHRDLRCEIVGDGPALEGLKRLGEDLGISKNLVFTGLIPFEKVPERIATFDVCVTPDPSNPYNDSCTTIKTMEYMALRKPVACFETHENRVTAGDAALYAANNDSRELAAVIDQLLRDPDLRDRMGLLGRQRIDEGLTWSHQARQLIRLYNELFST
ncbi:MAG TPA: glycosyltransferase WbuB [Planctomycetaceae bacterium]|nr:glycosyltransferase WbuB [Planctomycetaceae bacterium]